jgi:hypothetical protein
VCIKEELHHEGHEAHEEKLIKINLRGLRVLRGEKIVCPYEKYNV